jgi:hypothetical protein
MTEKQFEDFLKEAVQDYNRPSEVPREAMWARIEEARRASRAGGKVTFLASPWLRWGVGLAATLALGIGIGMNLDRSGPTGPTAAVDPAPTASLGAADSDADVYRLVALGHLSRTEAFLSMFRTDVRAGRTDYQVDNPARELLTTTRLLQGSQSIRDQRLLELLDELELVLVQIAQLRPDLDGEEAELVTQAIEQRSVLLRLRAAADAAPELRGVQGVL